MVRKRQAALVALVLTLAGGLLFTLVAARGANAQTSLPRLHVTALTLHADTIHPQIEKPFHLLINAHFTEGLKSVDFVVLPNLAELEDLGDERHTLAASNGTDFSETITVVAHKSGTLHVDPVYFNAIDARDGKAKQFRSNDLTLTVEGGTLEDPFSGVRHLIALLFKVALAFVALFVIVTIFFRRRPLKAPPEPPVVVLPPARPVRTARDALSDLLGELRANPTRAQVMSVRKSLWAMAGAGSGETLTDVLRRSHDAALDPVLRLTERAAFIHDAYLQGAIQDMIQGLEHFLR
ncbi:MAG: hypothetical protein M3N19_10065 [Candidatus Eremiobacteraeota bacterium]|nr:hypothetical protein [Candidatus Eremiobacteraeota bacterium]